MNILASIFGVIILICSITMLPVTSSEQVIDIKTLAELNRYYSGLILGNMLVWVSALTKNKHLEDI